jgi:hypothetical protein
MGPACDRGEMSTVTMTTGDESRRDRDKIAELNEIHARLRWWTPDEIVGLIGEDRDLAEAVWRDDEARRMLLEGLAALDPVAADELHARFGDERVPREAGVGRRLRGSLGRWSRRRT